MIHVATSGHRPPRVHKHSQPYDQEQHRRLTAFARKALEAADDIHIHVGMALGWDQAVADACAQLQIPYTAHYLLNQHTRWKSAWAKALHLELVDTANKKCLHVPTPEMSYAETLQARNECMVDNAERVVALYNPRHGKGGTANCLRYADAEGKDIRGLWRAWVAYEEEKFADKYDHDAEADHIRRHT